MVGGVSCLIAKRCSVSPSLRIIPTTHVRVDSLGNKKTLQKKSAEAGKKKLSVSDFMSVAVESQAATKGKKTKISSKQDFLSAAPKKKGKTSCSSK